MEKNLTLIPVSGATKGRGFLRTDVYNTQLFSMFNKSISGIFILLFLIANSMGQQQHIGLADYKLPFLKRRTLDMEFSLMGENRFHTYADLDPAHFNATRLENSLRLHYHGYKNLRRYQGETFIHLYQDLSGNRNHSDGMTSENLNMDPRLHADFINRVYLSRKFFMEMDLQVDNSTGWLKQFRNLEDYDLQFNRFHNDLKAYLPLKIGFGRIERVEDLRHAMVILEELAAVNRTNRSHSKDDVLHLAEFISHLKNKRIFDTRLQRMHELKSLDEYLLRNFNIHNYDGTYFSTLNDFWLYGGKTVRYSGSRLSLAFIPGFRYFNFVENITLPAQTTHESFDRTLLVFAGSEYIWEKPLSLRWQFSTQLYAYAGYSQKNWSYSTYDVTTPNGQGGFLQSWGYYPNTRSSFLLGYSGQYLTVLRRDPVTLIDIRSSGMRGLSFLKWSYYISPRFQLLVDYNVDYQYTDSDSYDHLDFFYSPRHAGNPYWMPVSLQLSGEAFSQALFIHMRYSFF
jgi:hypothetical protein